MDGKEKETLGDLLIEGLPEGSYLQKRLKLWKDLTGYAQEFPNKLGDVLRVVLVLEPDISLHKALWSVSVYRPDTFRKTNSAALGSLMGSDPKVAETRGSKWIRTS